MLVIRDIQLEAFSKLPRDHFEEQLVDHFFQFYPIECQELGKEQIRNFIKFGIERAMGYGYASQREVSFFVGIMFCLGSYFDEDPQFPWVAEQLANNQISDSFERIDRLFETMIDYLDKTAGPDNTFLVKALLRIRSFDMDNLNTIELASVKDVLFSLVNDFYPEKCFFMGETLLGDFIEYGIVSAEKYNVLSAKGKVVFVTMMFMQGSGFDKDQLCPWVGKILNDSAQTDEFLKIEKLYNTAIQHINHSLTGSEVGS